MLVVDAMIGQDAVKVSKGFHDRLDLTGVVLTKLDGDARGGAALSVKEVTGAPVRFAGIGEGTDKFEPFRPDGMASRVLGMGDVVGLMKDFQDVVDEEKAAEDAMKMLQGDFTLDDFLDQIRMIQKMGSLQGHRREDARRWITLPAGREPRRPRAREDRGDDHRASPAFEKKDPYALIREPGARGAHREGLRHAGASGERARPDASSS